MSHGAVSHSDLVEISLSNLREHREDAARWLAVEVLLSDEAALEDDDLVDRLCRLQDRLEAQIRQRYGIA
jgi:hypothetical protein